MTEEQRYEEQYDASCEAALEWVEQEIMPSLLEWEFNNSPEYIPGPALLHVFINAVKYLGHMGFEAEDLKEMVDINIDMVDNDTYH